MQKTYVVLATGYPGGIWRSLYLTFPFNKYQAKQLIHGVK
jgi:hypothetical protein